MHVFLRNKKKTIIFYTFIDIILWMFCEIKITNMSNSENIENVKKWFMSSKPLLTMLLVQIISTGMQLLSRVILVQGTFIFALITYRYLVAAICVVPFALYFER